MTKIGDGGGKDDQQSATQNTMVADGGGSNINAAGGGDLPGAAVPAAFTFGNWKVCLHSPPLGSNSFK